MLVGGHWSLLEVIVVGAGCHVSVWVVGPVLLLSVGGWG